MPSAKNVEMLQQVSEELHASQGVFIIDYTGLSVKETQQMRRDLRAAQAQMKVFKNNIVRRALKEADMPEIDSMLEGSCAFVFFGEDPVGPAKVIKEVAKTVETVQFKGGISDGAVLSQEQVVAIADLPSKEEMIAKLLGSFMSPLQGLVQVCTGPARGAITALSRIEEQKQNEAA